MNILNKRPKQISFYAAGLALSALAVALLAVTIAAGTAQAQTPDNTYPDPQPCGPGAGTAFMEEPHEVTTGHFALFDAYWQWTHQSTIDKPENEGVLHTNECPPLMVETTKRIGSKTVTETTRSASNIDIGEAIMHVLEKHKATVVATNAEITKGKLSLEEYPDVKKHASAGDKVWWLQLDDPDVDGRR